MNHEHLIIRAEMNKAFYNLHDDRKLLVSSFEKLIYRLNMNIEIGPHLWYCNDIGNEGWTVFAIINTSHVAIHIWTEEKLAQFDFYTCGELKFEPIVEFFDELGGTTKLEYKWLDRKHNLTILKESHPCQTQQESEC